MEKHSIDDLKWRFVLEYRSVGRGRFFKTSNGRMKEKTVGYEFVKTVGAGEIELSEWYEAMECAVKHEGKENLLTRIVDYCRRLAWLHSEKAVRQYALECLSSGAYKAWEDFNLVEC